MSSFEDAFELTGHGIFNHIVLFMSGLVLLHTMMESLGIGYIITAAQCHLELSVNQKGLINSAAFIGIMSTAIFWGYLSDRYGRRTVMLPSISAAGAASFASTLAVNFWSMFFLRFLTGCFVSASSATVFAYLGEMHSNARRSRAIAFASTFISLTFIVLPILAWLILPGTWSFPFLHVTVYSWRVFVWSWCLPGVAAAVMLLVLPESPRYLLSAHGADTALPVLAKMYAWNKRKKKENYPVKEITRIPLQLIHRGFRVAALNLVHLGRPPLLRCVLISHISMFMIFMMSSGLYTWMPDILNELLYNVHHPTTMCKVMMKKYAVDTFEPNQCKKSTIIHDMVYPVSIIMGTMCGITYVTIGVIIGRYCKIKVYCSTLVISSLSLAISGVLSEPVTTIVLFVCGLCSGCTASVMAAISVEVFPTSVRALALCTLYMFGRFGAALGANLLGLAMHKHCEPVFLFLTLGTASSALLMLLWPDSAKVRGEMEAKGFVY